MKKLLTGAFICVAFLSTAAIAGGEAELIELDKAWGSAGTANDNDTVAGFLSDDLISVDGSGVGGKAEQLAGDPAPEGATYEPGDYQVHFLDENTAIMTHSVAGDQEHYSLHVWAKNDGKWQVIATSSTPADTEE